MLCYLDILISKSCSIFHAKVLQRYIILYIFAKNINRIEGRATWRFILYWRLRQLNIRIRVPKFILTAVAAKVENKNKKQFYWFGGFWVQLRVSRLLIVRNTCFRTNVYKANRLRLTCSDLPFYVLLSLP